MAVYNKSGTALQSVYGKNGIRLAQCYDKSGSALLPIGQDYFEDENGAKSNIYLNQIGTLTYMQAFCMYGGKYYSTDGSHIAEQDANFNVLRNVEINLGHGNSLQLGSNGKAYASGWDDQKIYVVDLATLTVTDTITLPTTGYTTCAVDDVNHIAYIWQRDTRPNTESKYNFIVYDYVNEQTISTTETEIAFAAMQAVDMYDDRFLVLNGNETGAGMPNGYRWYNKSGKVVAYYVIGTQSGNEPEGVFVNRNTGKVEISYLDKKVYLINQ